MKTVFGLMKYIVCAALILAVLFADSSTFQVNAASGSITVTSELTGDGKQIYSGDSLKDAFAACERGCVVNVGRRITLTEDVVLKAEVALSGYSNISFSGHKIMLEVNGAILSETRFKMSEIVAVHSYSTVEMRRESGSYVYYLLTQTPDFGEEQPEFTTGGNLFGAAVDAENALIYQDATVDGILSSDLAGHISMQATNSETITYSFVGTVSIAGRNYIANGCVMTASATNYDYEGSVDKVYTIILLGDVNGNGCIDAADASLIARHAADAGELTGNALLAADANRDGAVTAEDAQLICEKYVRRDSYRTPL